MLGKLLLLAALLGLCLTPAFGDDDEDAIQLPRPACDDCQKEAVELEASFRLDNDFNPTANGAIKYNLRSQRSEVQASIKIKDKLPFGIAEQALFVVRSRLEQDLVINGQPSVTPFKATDYLKEGYFVLKRVGGQPIALYCGTTEATYGQDFQGTLDYQNDAAHAMTDPDQGQVKGCTVILDQELVKIVDSVEAMFFSSNPDFFKGGIGHLDSFSFRVTKSLGEHFQGEVSFMHKGNTYQQELKPADKLSVGATYRFGRWTIWGETVWMKNSESYANAHVGGTAGVHRITGPGQIDFEVTGVQDTLKQFALGYELYWSKHLSTGFTGRYTTCTGGNLGCVNARGYGQGPGFDIALRWTYGKGDDFENPTWIHKKGAAAVKKLFRMRDHCRD